MPIDTAEDRRAIAGIDRLAGPSVTPNIAKDAEWRQQAGYGYSGIASGEPEEPVSGGSCGSNAMQMQGRADNRWGKGRFASPRFSAKKS